VLTRTKIDVKNCVVIKMGKKADRRPYINSPCLERSFHRVVIYTMPKTNIDIKECIDCGMWGYTNVNVTR
jgi:hypothetical protein